MPDSDSPVVPQDLPGLHKYSLDVCLPPGIEFPECGQPMLEQIFGMYFGGFKLPSERPESYFRRLARSGRILQDDGHVYIIKGRTGFDFILQEETIKDVEEIIPIYSGSAIGVIGEKVPAKYHTIKLTYQRQLAPGEIHSVSEMGRQIGKPIKTTVHQAEAILPEQDA